MPISTEQLEEELRQHGGNLTIDELSSDDALLLLNRAYWELLANFGFRETEATVSFSTSQGNRKYELPTSSHAVNIISIVNPDSEAHVQLIRTTKQTYENTFVNQTTSEAFPTNYIRDNNCIILWPTPDEEYTVYIRYWKNLDDLIADPSNYPDMPRNWHEIVLYGALYRWFLRQLDYDKANVIKAYHANLIASTVPVEAKEETDNKESGINYLGYGSNYVG